MTRDVAVEDAIRRIRLDLAKARADAGLSQARLEAASGVRQPEISKIETGRNVPNVTTLLKCLVPLGKTIRVVDL